MKEEREFHSLRGKCNSHFSAARAEGELHRWSVLMSCTPQPDTHIFQCWWRLDTETRASEIKPCERTGIGYGRQAGEGVGILPGSSPGWIQGFPQDDGIGD